MREITDIKEMQQIELNILEFVDKVCKDNNIKYFLSDGTLIGAIRHKGFIPWDDDIDITMPRPDYEKFLSIMDNLNSDRYECLHFSKKFKNYFYSFAKVVDLNTVLTESSFIRNEKMGAFIDVFPLDGVTDEKTFLKNRKKFGKLSAILNLSASKKFEPSKKNKINTIIKLLLYPISKMFGYKFWAKRLQKIMLKYNIDESNYVCRYCCVSKKNVYPKEVFTDCINVEFEKQNFLTTKEYDAYLTRLYGDYMTPPPEDKQKPHHDVKLYWKD